MAKLTTQEFDNWAEKLLEDHLEAVTLLLQDFNILEAPSAETLMLAFVKHKEPFINRLAAIQEMPGGMSFANGKNAGSALGDFFAKALDIANGIGTAAAVLGTFQGTKEASKEAAKNKVKDEAKKEEGFKIFGMEVPKVYVFGLGGLTLLIIVMLLVSKKKKA